MMSIYNSIGSNNVEQSIYSTINELSSFHDDQEPSVTTSASLFTDHLYPTSHQDHSQPIFVQIPICHNTHHQINRQQTNEIKSELIKSEVENVSTSLPSTQSTICTQSSTVTTTIPSANICSTQQQTPSTLITARPKSSIKCFKCTQCPFISISQTGLDVHIDKNHHNGNQASVFKKLKCFGCHNVFYSQNSLKVHLVKDHQMSDDEIKYLVQNLVLDSENVDENSLATPIKQKIYLKNLSILKAPEFRTDEGDSNGPELYNTFNELNHYAKDCDQSENQNVHSELYDDVPDDFINLIDDEFNEQNDDLMENNGHNDFHSKIFVKDVNNLKNPNYTSGHQFLFDGVEDFRDETQQINLIDTPPPIAQTAIQTVFHNQNFNSNFDNSMQPKKKPCKIFIKNVDILPKPIILQTSGHSFVSTSPQPQPLYSGNCIIPFGKQAHSTYLRTPNDSSFVCSPGNSLNEDTAPSQQKKIFIKNIDILKETITTAPVAKKSMLHLRTVDDINLMNVNETPNLRESFQDDTPRVQSIVDNSNEHYNVVEDYNITNDQCLESVIDDFVTYYQNNETDRLQFTFQDMHSVNFQTNNGNSNSDFHLDSISVDCPTNNAVNFENITDSTTSSTDVDEKAVNKTEQLNGNNNQMYYNNFEEGAERNASSGVYDYEKAFDEEILFVCAEEVINSSEQNRDTGTTPNDERLITESNNCLVSPETTQDAKEMSKNEEPAKGRIYVVSNLMKTTSDSDDGNKQLNKVISNNGNKMVEVIESNDEEDVQCINTDNTKLVQVFLLDNTKKTTKRKKAIGRPKGGRNNRYTLNAVNSKDNSAIKYQCTQNCAMRFSSSKVLSFHEQCHDQNQKNRIICPKCKDDNFRNFNTLHTHLWRQHSIDMELYSCELCDFKTPILSRLLNTHMKIHSDERNYKCETCDKAFKNAKQLKNHRALHNEVRVIRKCEFCDKLFFNKKYLRNHVKSVHEMLKEFKCIVCDHIFSSVVACRTHMLNHTNMSKKFQCEKCSYSSNDGSGFRRHLKIHENTKTYECRSCPFRCIQSKQFKSHILKLHPDIANEVLFSCTKCAFVTVNRSKFDLHQLHHEFKEASKDVECEGEIVDESDDDEVLIKFSK